MTDQERKSGSNRLIIDPVSELPDETRLWRAVLGQAVRDIYSSSPRDRSSVILWINSSDFDACCTLASVPTEDMREQILNLAALPNSLARKYGAMLKHLLTSDIYD